MTPVAVVLMLFLAFDWLGEDAVKRRWLTAIFILVATPEFFYLGLVYQPSLVAICGVVVAHLVVRRTIYTQQNLKWWSPGFLLALALFGLGAACRWDIATYGAVIVTDMLVGVPHGNQRWQLPIRQRLLCCVAWAVLGLIAVFVAIGISGYTPLDVLNLSRLFFANAEHDTLGISGPAVLLTISGLISYFSPIAILFGLVGIGWLGLHRDPKLVPIMVGIVLVLPWLTHGTPKYLLAGIPGITTCMILGFEILWNKIKQPAVQNGVRAVLVAGLLAIWLIGIRVDSDSAWGPGFEIRDYDHPKVNGIHVSPVIGPGVALPFSEGPRPLFGHFYVLLGGQWRSLVNSLYAEQENAVHVASDKAIPELRTDRENPGIAVFVQQGYTITADSDIHDFIDRWDFTDAHGKSATMWALDARDAIYHKDGVNQLLQVGDTVVIYGWPSDLRRLYQISPTSLQKLGPMSAVLNLKTLAQTAP
jgi:hypothetical protein